MLQLNAGDFISDVREKFAIKIADFDDTVVQGVLAAFDRACLEVIVQGHQERKAETLSPQQRGARTRAANRRKKQQGNAQAHDFGGGTQFNPPPNGGE